ncbi:MAG: hypothetical protein IT380_16165 [Myxococcales bacterium]|nr:hypothetical protein [Myxococcales bacterium]
MTTWRAWVKWNRSMEQTLIDGHHQAAGETTIAEARKHASRTGAPGILLVDQLADHDMLGRVWVLSGEELHRHFGSKTPTRKAIEADHDAFVERLEEGQAVAITAFLRGQAMAVLFAGKPERPRAKR